MVERTLLVFPPADPILNPKKIGGGDKINFPLPPRQVQRLEPQFNVLQNAFDRQKAQLTSSPDGTLPEQVLVFETIGTVAEFAKSISLIQGMEWLNGLDSIDFEQDEDFSLTDENKANKKIRGQLFLIMTDDVAMQQLLSMWHRFEKSPNMLFPRNLGKWRSIFRQLRNIRYWGVEDRMREAGVWSDWKERIETQPSEPVKVEIEAWFQKNAVSRNQASLDIRHNVSLAGGTVMQELSIEEIGYHGFLASIPISAVTESLLGNPIKLLTCERIMFFRSPGQTVMPTLDENDTEEEVVNVAHEDLANSKPPVVALLDGMPLERHSALIGRFELDDPDNYGSDYPAASRLHGTSIASIIVNGDLNVEQPPLGRKIYVRPILMANPNEWNGARSEILPPDRLFIDVIHQAILRLFEEADGRTPVGDSIKIINLSIGIWHLSFTRFISPLAKLLDWLSWKYKFLVVVSAGNQSDDIDLAIASDGLEKLAPAGLQNVYLRKLLADMRNRRIISPAESINSLTVGASHSDFTPLGSLDGRINLINYSSLPSPVSSAGFGFRQSIKPEILMPGGRQLYGKRILHETNKTILEVKAARRVPPGIRVATPGVSGGLNNTLYTCGTSNAAAFATRAGAQIFELLETLRHAEGHEHVSEEHVPSLLKALLVHGASWGQEGIELEELVNLPSDMRERNLLTKKYFARYLGYGAVSLEKIFACAEDRVTIIGCGSLASGESEIFKVPLPTSLNGAACVRKLIFTLAWISPVNCFHQRYRQCAIWARPGLIKDFATRREVDHHTVKRGTVQHEILEGDTVLELRGEESIDIQIHCHSDAGDFEEPIPYGLAVTFEVEGTAAPLGIYDEIHSKIAIKSRR